MLLLGNQHTAICGLARRCQMGSRSALKPPKRRGEAEDGHVRKERELGATRSRRRSVPARQSRRRPERPSRRASPKYGIAEAIQLMRTLPADQNVELVVRVVRATLASLDVRLPDIIEDATRKQKTVRDRIADFHAKNAELEKQLEAHRKEIAALEADLKETTDVKDRLQQAESSSRDGPGRPPRRQQGRR